MRHRSFSFQEFSQRYANPTEDWNLLQGSKATRNKKDKILLKQMIQIYKKMECQQQKVMIGLEAYQWAIEKGKFAKEKAREYYRRKY
ncbi:MAG: hypothetical protein Ct9H90mP2_02000 [Dehalococcoidia bacterium]|nr:MAG: hypothetical protein Ct9H90mP2_02000 [Dehalococcoidia bacterium]